MSLLIVIVGFATVEMEVLLLLAVARPITVVADISSAVYTTVESDFLYTRARTRYRHAFLVKVVACTYHILGFV